MSENTGQTADNGKSGPAEGVKRSRAAVPAYKKILLVASLALAAGGLGLHALAGGTPGTPAEGALATQTRGLVSPKGLLPTSRSAAANSDEPAGSEADASEANPWYPQMFRLGFSFFVGFCIAFALRVFLKVTAFAAGLVLLLLFGLQYAGIIVVDWSAIGGYYDTFAHWAVGQLSSLKTFITGYLPSTATATAGMVMGFRRR